jgi:hypothetical protein
VGGGDEIMNSTLFWAALILGVLFAYKYVIPVIVKFCYTKQWSWRDVGHELLTLPIDIFMISIALLLPNVFTNAPERPVLDNIPEEEHLRLLEEHMQLTSDYMSQRQNSIIFLLIGLGLLLLFVIISKSVKNSFETGEKSLGKWIALIFEYLFVTGVLMLSVVIGGGG